MAIIIIIIIIVTKLMHRMMTLARLSKTDSPEWMRQTDSLSVITPHFSAEFRAPTMRPW